MRPIGWLMSFLLAVNPVLIKVQAASSITARQSSANVREGSSFIFKWDIYLQLSDKGKLNEIIFGLWEKGYTTHYLMTVTKLGKAVENPHLSQTHPSYVGRVIWVGNISKSYVAFQLVNITLSDTNAYGCQLDVGGFTKTIHSMITLTVEKTSVMVNASSTFAPYVPLTKTASLGRPSLVQLNFQDVYINNTNFMFTWDYPDDNGGVEVTMFTVWYRTVGLVNNTQEEWSTVNVTQNRCSLRLNCCLTYEIMVTAWNRNGQSFTDPDNAARVTVLGDMTEHTTSRSKTTSNVLESNGNASSHESNSKIVFTYLPYLSVLAIPLFLWAAITKIRRRTPAKLIRIKEDDIAESGNEIEELEIAPDVPIPSWEFPRSNLAMERVVGNGAFGVVSKAYALDLPGKPDWTVVAVKSLQEGATGSERRDLYSELNLLKKLKPHPHIIKLLGCITAEKDDPYVIIEYVPYGDLLGYLRKSRGVNDCYYDYPEVKPTTNLTSEQMLKFAWQIADGMHYISSKKIIHRDLAARNVLVGENQRCKITDFGMARDVNLEEIYVPRSQGRVPVKWTAIEAITGAMKYSTKSDVWSFGIVLFEICTIGAEPYPRISPYTIPNVLLEGYRIPKPVYLKDELYDIMLKCWKTEPESRPSFESLCTSIRGLEMCANQNYVNIKYCLEAHRSESNI